MEDGGYSRPELWLSDGWASANDQGWTHPSTGPGRTVSGGVFTLSGFAAGRRE